MKKQKLLKSLTLAILLSGTSVMASDISSRNEHLMGINSTDNSQLNIYIKPRVNYLTQENINEGYSNDIDIFTDNEN